MDRLGVIHLPCIGYRDWPGSTDQGTTQVFFQLLNALAHLGFRCSQATRRLRKTQGIDDGDKGVHVDKYIHRALGFLLSVLLCLMPVEATIFASNPNSQACI